MAEPTQKQPNPSPEPRWAQDENTLEKILGQMADEVHGIPLADDFCSESQRVLESHAAEYPQLSAEIRSMGKVIVSLEQEGRQRQIQNTTPYEGKGNTNGLGMQPIEKKMVTPISPESVLSENSTEEEMVPSIQGFRILREIGRGGMGVVFEAEQIALRRRVAVKVLPGRDAEEEKKNGGTPELDCESGHTLDSLHGNESNVSRFLREARIVARLHHTNIVPVLEAGCEQGMYWYAMQLIHGLSLDRILKLLRHEQKESLQDYGIPPPGSMAYFRWICQRFLQVLDALAHVHHQGLLHRDIKPGNLILEPDGRIWITDFGLARMKDRPGCGHAVGTLRYMAPEQRRGEATTLTDLCAVGLTLYEMFALQPAFAASSRMELIERVETGRVCCPLAILVPTLPLDLVKITEKAIRVAPESRYQTAEAFADDLRRFLDGRPVNARPISPWEKFLRWRRRNPWIYFPSLTAATAVIIAFIVGWSGWLITRDALKEEAFQRHQAESNLEMVVQEQELAREQRDRAERNLRLSLDILDSAFPTLASRKAFAVYSIPLPSERTRLKTLLRFYEELTRGNETNPRLQTELAKTLARIGTVQLTLGEPLDAILSFEKSLTYEENATKSKETETLESEETTATNTEALETRQVRIAGIHNDLGYAKRLVKWTGKENAETELNGTDGANAATPSIVSEQTNGNGTISPLDARGEYRAALAILEPYHSPAAQLERIRSLNALGILSSEPADGESEWNAESCHRRAVTEADQLLTIGNLPEYRFAQAQSQRLLIQTLRVTNEAKYEAEMESLATAAIATLRALIVENPSFPEYRKELAQVLVSLTNSPLSHARFREAAEITDQLVDQFPYVPEYQLLAASVQARHALQYFSEGNLQAGVSEIYEAAAHLRLIQSHFPNLLERSSQSNNNMNSLPFVANFETTLRQIVPFRNNAISTDGTFSEYLRKIVDATTETTTPVSETLLNPLSNMVDQLTRWFMY